MRLRLVDSGSSVFTSPHKDTLIFPIKTTLKLTGIGGATSDLMSSFIYIVLDVKGEYVVIHYQSVYYLSTLPIALFATGSFEQQGWTFHLNVQEPCMTKTGGVCVSLFKDRVTGFHCLLEHTHTSSTILERRELVHQLVTKPNLARVPMAYKVLHNMTTIPFWISSDWGKGIRRLWSIHVKKRGYNLSRIK
jgi:hypothetical protein